MIHQIRILFCIVFALYGFPLEAQDLTPAKKKVVEQIESQHQAYKDIAMKIWSLAEVGYQEYESSKLLQSTLQKNGFSIEVGQAGIPTAFIASYGSGKPVIAVLGEFDALPGVSQAAVPYREERSGVNAGHACGHHLFGTGSAAAAIAGKGLDG